MKVRDFKILAKLPSGYDYELFNQDDSILIIGKKFQTIIGFRLKDEDLVPIKFEYGSFANET